MCSMIFNIDNSLSIDKTELNFRFVALLCKIVRSSNLLGGGRSSWNVERWEQERMRTSTYQPALKHGDVVSWPPTFSPRCFEFRPENWKHTWFLAVRTWFQRNYVIAAPFHVQFYFRELGQFSEKHDYCSWPQQTEKNTKQQGAAMKAFIRKTSKEGRVKISAKIRWNGVLIPYFVFIVLSQLYIGDRQHKRRISWWATNCAIVRISFEYMLLVSH